MRAYAASVGRRASVSVIDTATNTVTATIPVGGRPVRWHCCRTARARYVVSADNNNVAVIDTATNTVTATIPSATFPMASPSARTARAYVANFSSDNVSVINTATNT